MQQSSDELLSPQQPGVIGPGVTCGRDRRRRVCVSARCRCDGATGGGDERCGQLGGLLTDEWKSSDTFSQRNETDQRAIQTNNAQARASDIDASRARLSRMTAIDALKQFLPETNVQTWRRCTSRSA